MDFVTVHHPDLPGQSARMSRPRNGWAPDVATVHLPPTSPSPDPVEEDKPAAGESKSKKPKE